MEASKQHQLISEVKELALELGRTPTRDELNMRYPGAKDRARALFGSFGVLIQAAGLESAAQEKAKAKKITNDVFKRDLSAHLSAYEPIEPKEQEPWPKIAVISDIHFPFESQRVLDKFYAFVKEAEPEYVVLNGDAADAYSFSKFPRSHNIFTPREETELARTKNEEFWKQVKAGCPQAKCFQTLGNHDLRALKRVLESFPAAEDWIERAVRDQFTFDGVETIYDHRQEIIIGDIAIFHGYRTGLGAHRDYTHMNCINGHTHKGGVVFRQIQGRVLWELNSGYAGDPQSKGLSYTPQKIIEWTPGFGFVDKYGARFISC